VDRSRRRRENEREGAGAAERVHDDGPPLFSRTATVAACVGFVLLGALQAYYGPAIPALRARFGLAPSGAGLALSMLFGGAVAGVLVGGILHRHTRNSRLLVTSFLVMAGGALGFALSPNWFCALAASLVSGFGAGGMDYGLNQLFAIGFGRRSPAMLGILNAFFGVGAIAGPLTISLLGAHNYRYAFAATAVLLVIACGFFRTVRDAEPKHPAATTDPDHAVDPHAGTPAAASTPITSVIPIVVAFLALYALQVTIETGVGAWEPTYLQLLGHSANFAANATSAFWLGLTVGRFLLAPLTLRWSEPTIVCFSCLGTTICLAFAVIPAFAPYALAGAGLFNAPVFPAALPWLHRSAPNVRWAGTGAILTANLGGMAAGPLLGLAIEVFGSGSMPWALTITSIVCVVLAVRLKTTTHRING
jgi:FHS family glucose/mannose:H+ symporter-like MFS transporter